MEYKGNFHASEIFNGQSWEPLLVRESSSQSATDQLTRIEKTAMIADSTHFDLESLRNALIGR
jgi:hypothetical protein